MKILLIRPKPDKETIGLQNVMICEPLELMTIDAVLKNNNHKTAMLDMIIEKKSIEYFIKGYNPDVICITGYITHINTIKEYAKNAKEINSNIKVVVGGVHAKLCPEDFESNYIDYICKENEDFYKYLGCKNLEKALPNRKLKQKYRKKYYYLFYQNCALIKTSFGCPYDCKFCYCKEIEEYSTRNVDEVILELKTIKQKEVYIVDDDFLFNRARLLEFYEKLKENNIKKNYLVYGRADFISKNEDIIQKLHSVGLRSVIIGIEAFTQDKLNDYNKKTTLEDNKKATEILRKYDIECYGTIILDTHWGKKEFKALTKYIKSLDLKYVNLQPITPMPKTDLFDKNYNYLIDYKEHEKWDMAHIVIKPTKLSVRQYYFEIIKCYYKITFAPKNILYTIRKYGIYRSLKLSIGSSVVSYQYFKKLFKGE